MLAVHSRQPAQSAIHKCAARRSAKHFGSMLTRNRRPSRLGGVGVSADLDGWSKQAGSMT